MPRILYLLVVIGACLPADGQSYNIYTFAGGAIPSGNALSTSLGYISAIAVDPTGPMYLGLSTSAIVVKIKSDGTLETVAGGGSAPVSGLRANGLRATDVRLSSIAGLALDGAGDLYIEDSGDPYGGGSALYKVSDGTITVVLPSSTVGMVDLSPPTGIAADAAGNIYIAASSIVWKVSNGTITSVVRLAMPAAVAVDAAGNIYIADQNSIYKVAGGVTTLIGTIPLNNEWASDRALAVDPAGDAIWVADTGAGVIYELSNGNLTTVAAVTSPTGLALDANQNLYFTDNGNWTLRKTSPGGVSSVAGNGFISYAGDGGPATSAQISPGAVAVDGAGNVYISEPANHVVRKVSASGTITTVAGNGSGGNSGDGGAATSATLGQPNVIAVDAVGDLYIADAIMHRVRKVSNGIISAFAGNGGFGYSGDNGPASAALLGDTEGLAVDGQGSLYIADSGYNVVRKVANGIITTFAGGGQGGDGGPALGAQLNHPASLTMDSSGNLFIADSAGNDIREVSGGIITTLKPSNPVGANGIGIAVDADDNLYAATWSGVERIANGGAVTSIAGNQNDGFGGDGGPATAASLSLVRGLALDSAGRVYVADSGNGWIRVLVPTSCSYTVSPLNWIAESAGDTYTVAVQTGPACAWSVDGQPDWITASGSGAHSGSGTVALTVAADGGPPRVGSFSVGGVQVSVFQYGSGSSCTFSVSPQQAALIPADGGGGELTVADPFGCPFSVTSTLPWLSFFNQFLSGNGQTNQILFSNDLIGLPVSYSSPPNGGPQRTGTVDIAGTPVQVTQASALPAGFTSAASMAQIAAGGGWGTTITLVNTGSSPANLSLQFFDNFGNPLALPLAFPQSPSTEPTTASTYDNTLAPGATLVVATAASPTDDLSVGWAHLFTNGAVGGFAIFRDAIRQQEAVVPLVSDDLQSHLLWFDNTAGFVTSAALVNLTLPVWTVSSSAANFIEGTARDATGAVLPAPAFAEWDLNALSHAAFALPQAVPWTAGLTGTIEFDDIFQNLTDGLMSALGLRFSPSGAFTTIPVLTESDTGGGSFAHLAVGGGWQTTIVLVNTGSASASAALNFLDEAGNPLPLSFTSASQTAGPPSTTFETVLNSLGTAVLTSVGDDSQPVQVGSAELTTNGGVGGFAIFRSTSNGQEAIVPLMSGASSASLLWFDDTNGYVTSAAVANDASKAASIPVVIRDRNGAVIGQDTLTLPAHGHTSFSLPARFAATTSQTGTLEFDTPAEGQISVIGLRFTPTGAFTTLPPLGK